MELPTHRTRPVIGGDAIRFKSQKQSQAKNRFSACGGRVMVVPVIGLSGNKAWC